MSHQLVPNTHLDPKDKRDDAYYREVAERFVRDVPHGSDLNISMEDASYGAVILKMPYQHCLVGDKDRGLIHGGVLISLIDSASGVATFCSLPDMTAVATLDLRVDNMRPAIEEKDIYAMAECYRMTSKIAFVRATAYQDWDKPLATSTSSFMLASSSKSFLDKDKS